MQRELGGCVTDHLEHHVRIEAHPVAVDLRSHVGEHPSRVVVEEVDAGVGQHPQRRGVDRIEFVVGDEWGRRQLTPGLREGRLVADDAPSPFRPSPSSLTHVAKLVRGEFLEVRTSMTNIDACVSEVAEVSGRRPRSRTCRFEHRARPRPPRPPRGPERSWRKGHAAELTTRLYRCVSLGSAPPARTDVTAPDHICHIAALRLDP